MGVGDGMVILGMFIFGVFMFILGMFILGIELVVVVGVGVVVELGVGVGVLLGVGDGVLFREFLIDRYLCLFGFVKVIMFDRLFKIRLGVSFFWFMMIVIVGVSL